MNDPNTGQITARELFQDIEDSVNKMFYTASLRNEASIAFTSDKIAYLNKLEAHYKNVMLKLKHAENTCIELYDGLQNTCKRIEAKVKDVEEKNWYDYLLKENKLRQRICIIILVSFFFRDYDLIGWLLVAVYVSFTKF